jgi:transcriptional regulator with XRE-family HTH domain
VKRLNASKGEWPQVVAGSGVPMSTVARIASGETENPGVQQIEKLAAYFRRNGKNKQNVGGSETRTPMG